MFPPTAAAAAVFSIILYSPINDTTPCVGGVVCAIQRRPDPVPKYVQVFIPTSPGYNMRAVFFSSLSGRRTGSLPVGVYIFFYYSLDFTSNTAHTHIPWYIHIYRIPYTDGQSLREMFSLSPPPAIYTISYTLCVERIRNR